jgi:hypothetical protein
MKEERMEEKMTVEILGEHVYRGEYLAYHKFNLRAWKRKVDYLFWAK